MKIEGIIYFYTPLEKDFDSRDEIREHLARPTAGRFFLKKNENEQWTIPFHSTTHLISILSKVDSGDINDLDFSIDKDKKPYENTIDIKNRRCFRIKIESINAEYHPRKYMGYAYCGNLPKDGFSEKSIGVLTQLDLEKDRQRFFDDFIDAGIQLDKMFTFEVRRRILTEEQALINLAIPYNDEVDNVK